MGLRDFKGYHVDFLTLEFKVWEHPNLNVSTLTLKDQFLKIWYCFCCLDLRCQHIQHSICQNHIFNKSSNKLMNEIIV